MFKSVFAKYFTVTACLLFLAMIALGGVQTIFMNNYWMEDKRTQLTENATKIAAHAADVTVRDGKDAHIYRIVTQRVQPTITLLADGLDADVLIVDTKGNVLVSSRNVSTKVAAVPASALSQLGAQYFAVGDLDGFFQSAHYTAASSILVDGSVCVGYVIVASPADSLFTYLSETFRVYLMSALVVLLVVTVIIYITTYRMVKPLREMAIATRQFAQGDFSYRIHVKGRDEIAELAAALNSMAVSLSATENMSRSFVANVSHELKTPMTTIGGFVDGILDGTIPPDKQEHYLRIVSDETKRLSRLVKSMLELSRIDNGTVALKPVSFDLTETVYSALLSFEQRIEDKQIQIEGLADCQRTLVVADYDLVGQVVYNLLDNAVKFVDQNGTITVGVKKEDGRVYCSVRNSGAGLSAEEMPRVFERFYKTDHSRSLDKTGVGLGLYIVKTVVNLHKGEIYVRSMQGEYCEFVFWLPSPTEKSKADKHGNKS
ncbi:MAG: HAMP domain-containing histidine kinase [Clostridia bacterium]|nr:HAMP domain-containing histidine kinase [Clostridia bacterium]